MTADYERGQWAAFNKVLDYINTLEDKFIDKHKIYSAVFAMRPAKSSEEMLVDLSNLIDELKQEMNKP